MKRPSIKDNRCPKCGSHDLCSWTNDHVVICETCGTNLAWPRDGAFYYGGGRGTNRLAAPTSHANTTTSTVH